MKYLYFSDRFKYIHPTKLSMGTKDFSSDDLQKAIENTKNIVFNDELFEKARRFSCNTVPDNQRGNLLIFPSKTGYDKEMTDEMITYYRKNMLSFVSKVFKSVITQLKCEYYDKSDPLEFYTIDDTGAYFNAFFTNMRMKAKDIFSPQSIVIYVAGTKDTTASYLFEEFLDKCYTEAAKHDRSIIRNKKDSKDQLYFDNYHSFLSYSFSTNDFYQIGVNDNEVYHKVVNSRKRKTSVLMEYAVFD